MVKSGVAENAFEDEASACGIFRQKFQAQTMRVPVYLVCAALAVAVKSEELSSYYGRQLEPVDLSADQQTISYFLPRLTAKYRPNREWQDPRYYVLPELQSNNIDNQMSLNPEGRMKRGGVGDKPSLSIVNSIDVLRNRLILAMARKNNQAGIIRNRDYLCKIGKRSPLLDPRQCEEFASSKQFLPDN